MLLTNARLGFQMIYNIYYSAILDGSYWCVRIYNTDVSSSFFDPGDNT